MQERPRSQVLKMRTHAGKPAHLLIEGKITTTRVKKIADFLEDNTVITTTNITSSLGNDKQSKRVKAHLARNLQIQQAIALVLQDVLKKAPTTSEKTITEELDNTNGLTQKALEGEHSISSTELNQCLQRLIVLFSPKTLGIVLSILSLKAQAS